MINYEINLKNFSLTADGLLGVSLIYLIFFGTILMQKNKNYLIEIVINDCVVFIFLILCLIISKELVINNHYLTCNDSLIIDSLSYFSKYLIIFSTIVCLIMIKHYVSYQKINFFEYTLIFLFSILSLFILCSSHDLLTIYIVIELQSLTFYILSASKKSSIYSVKSGLKYFILGSFSSGFLLFGISFSYGYVGNVNFDEICLIFEKMQNPFNMINYSNSFFMKDLVLLIKYVYPCLVLCHPDVPPFTITLYKITPVFGPLKNGKDSSFAAIVLSLDVTSTRHDLVTGLHPLTSLRQWIELIKDESCKSDYNSNASLLEYLMYANDNGYFFSEEFVKLLEKKYKQQKSLESIGLPELLFHRHPMPLILEYHNNVDSGPCNINHALIREAVEIYGEEFLKDVDTSTIRKANAGEFLKMTRSYSKTYAYIAEECVLKNQEFMRSVSLNEFDPTSAKAVTDCVDKAADLLPPQPHNFNNPMDKRVALADCVRKADLMHSGEDFMKSVDECYNKHSYDYEKKN